MKTTDTEFATDEESIKEFVRYLLFRIGKISTIYTRDELQIELIKKTKCTVSDADDFLCEMDDLGLELCRETVGGYYLQKFALMRDFISDVDVKKIKEMMDETEYESEKGNGRS